MFFDTTMPLIQDEEICVSAQGQLFIHMLNRTSKEIKHVSQCGPTANLNYNKGFDLEEKGISADTTIQG
jgi:hypothetical protein